MATSLWGGYEKPDSPTPGTLTVFVRIGGTGARSAVPSAQQEFIYAASLYPDGGAPSGELSVGEADGSTVTFMFEKPPLAEGGTLTLEIFAFAKDTAEADLLKDAALLTGRESGLEAEGTSMTVGAMTLTPNKAATAPKGTVSLKVKVPDGYTLEIGGADKDKFTVTGTTPNFTIQQNGEGIPAGTYSLILNVKKGNETVHAFPDEINVWPGMRTDTWVGLAAGAALEITQATLETTLFVFGSGGWYASNGYSQDMASDGNSGSFLAPFATIQKAIDTVIAANDGASEYTIYVDGTLTYGGSNAKGMADLSALDKPLTLTIKPLLADAKSTLNADSLTRVIYASPDSGGSLDLILERLVITGGKGNGGGIYMNGGTLEVTDCEISGNTTSSGNGGGVFVSGGTFTMSGAAKVAADNDIYLNHSGANYATIQVAGALTAASPIATITLDAYTEDRTLLSAGDGVTITQTICDKFALAPDPSSSKEWRLVPDGTDAHGVLEEFLHEIYVDGSAGSDTNKGRHDSPLKTVAAAAKKKPRTIYLRNTTSETSFIYLTVNTDILLWEGASEAKITRSSAFTSSSLISINRNVTCKIKDIKIDGNNVEVSRSGGGIFNDGTLEITGGEITNCKSTNDGGAIYAEGGIWADGKLTISGTKISGNTARNGGGVYISDEVTFTMTNATVSDNTAKDGGGVFVDGSAFTMKDGTVSDNSSSYRGGGVYVDMNGTFTMEDGTISGNTATKDGGGVYVDSMGTKTKFTMEKGTISGNTAENGGGVYINNFYSDSLFTQNGGTVLDEIATYW